MRNLALMWVLAGCLLGCGDWKPPVSTFTDTRDGKTYKIVQIGSQVWFAENLNYAAEGSKCYGEDGDVIIGRDENNELITTTLSNVEVQANCAKYGHLYDWETALKACPAGYHLPSDDEWTALVNYAGGVKTAGTKLKSTAGWNDYQGMFGNGTDEFGFSALPGGQGYSDGDFYNAGSIGYWWSATEYDANDARFRYIIYEGEFVTWYNYVKTYLFSVRCVLDDGKERRK